LFRVLDTVFHACVALRTARLPGRVSRNLVDRPGPTSEPKAQVGLTDTVRDDTFADNEDKDMKIAIGIILGLIIGAGCRWFDIPVPSPPKLMGALLVVAMTVGYMGADALIARGFPHRGQATTAHLCGGPTGAPQGPGTLAQTKPSAADPPNP
jgi:XapX domain-containing protein